MVVGEKKKKQKHTIIYGLKFFSPDGKLKGIPNTCTGEVMEAEAALIFKTVSELLGT